MIHISGFERSQLLLLPEAIDDYVVADNPVRFIDAFVNGLDLAAAGFKRVTPKVTGRPGYAPGDLLKLYIYGYLNRVRSSRRLEAECHRNIEVIWLLRTLKPDFKTIADFRSDNRAAFRAVFHQFTLLCRGTQSFRARAAGGGRHAHQGGQQQEPQLYEELAGEVHQGGGQASGRIRNAGQPPNTALTEVSSKEYETNLDSDDLDHGNAQADQIIADNLSICRLKAMLSNQLAL